MEAVSQAVLIALLGWIALMVTPARILDGIGMLLWALILWAIGLSAVAGVAYAAYVYWHYVSIALAMWAALLAWCAVVLGAKAVLNWIVQRLSVPSTSERYSGSFSSKI